MNLKSILNPAGGLYYHLKAWRYKRKLWPPFITSINNFLCNWVPQNRNLVIFGGSGGYCLSPEFLSQFSNIVLIDPDPLAGIIFSARFQITIQVVQKNYLTDELNEQTSPFDQIMQDFPNHAFLFSNILGQLPYLTNWQNDRTVYVDSIKQSLASLIRTREWASFHDLLSFHFKTAHPLLCWPLLIKASSNEEIINNMQRQNQMRPHNIHVVDHLTENLFASTERKEKFYWQRTPHSLHIIEAAAHSW